MNILKQSTAATIKLGPFIDDTDGKTAETGLTISQADIRLSKNGGDIAQTNNSAGATHDELGYYNVPLDTTDTNTLGRLLVAVHESGALPVWKEFLVVTANVYDTLCSTDKLEVELASGHGLATATALQTVDDNVDAILVDTGTTLDTLIKDIPTVSEFNARTKPTADYFDPATDAVATVTNLTNLPTMPADWVTASGLKADAVTEIQSGLAKTTDIPSDYAKAGDAMTLTAAYDNAKDDVLTPLATVDSIVDAIKAKTDNLPASPAATGAAMTLTSAYDAAKTAATQASVNAIPTTPLLAANYTAPDNASITAIKAKTDLIPATPAQAGEYTSALSAIQADLDNPSQYKADVSGLATSSALATVDTVVDGIATTLANPDNFKADVSALALESTLTAMKGAGWSTETLAAIKSAIDALSSGGVDPAVIAAAILDALLADHTVAGSVAKAIADILEDTGTTLSNLITSIKAKTDLMDASAITYTPNVVGTDITLLRGDTFSATLTDVGALTGYVSIDFTVKRNTSNTDDEAVIRIRKNASGTGDGLLRLNRAAPTTETGEIVVDDEATGDITITLDETATDSLEIGAYLYDVQLITATAVKTLTSGRLNVTSDVTRAIV